MPLTAVPLISHVTSGLCSPTKQAHWTCQVSPSQAGRWEPEWLMGKHRVTCETPNLRARVQVELSTGRLTALAAWHSFLYHCSVQFRRSVVSDSLRPHESQHTRPHVHHQLPEFTQTHVHRVRDAIQPSHPPSSPSPPARNPSQHQSLFQ